jgi:tetratricopeptide (TPR) repeat protein
MSRTPPKPIPEDLVPDPDSPLLEVELVCNQCGRSFEREFEYAIVDPKAGKREDDEWDGVLLSRIVECDRCGAVDDYKLGERSYSRYVVGVLNTVASKRQGAQKDRVIVGISELWDGTITRRPSQAIAHLRDLAERRPCGEAWNRLGNAEERFGRPLAAEVSWRKALEVDPSDLESACSLAWSLAERDEWSEAFGFLQEGIKLLSGARDRDPGHRLNLSRSLVELLEWTLEITDEPIALMVGWDCTVSKKKPVITMSTVNLRRVKDWDRLAEILIDEDTMVAGLTSELPEEEPTILERRLAGDWTEPPAPESLTHATVIKPQRRVGRNAPCPCGSGKKYKKCCGR